MPIVNCPKCNTEFENKGLWGTKKFCSRKCANSRLRPKELRDRVSKKLTGRIGKSIFLSPEKLKSRNLKLRKTWDLKYENISFNELSWDLQRLRVIKEQNNSCGKCEITEWFGNKISLEVDHIDGNRKNNCRENLIAICPNCHSITTTWRGRNRKTIDHRTDEEILHAISQTENIHQALKFLNMACRGANYKRLQVLMEKNNISY